MPDATFQTATAVQQLDSHTYKADLSGEWVIGSVPHGGYVTSCFQQVVKKHFQTSLSGQKQPHALSLHLEFLRRTQVGPAEFRVRDVKLGRQTSCVHVSLFQADDGNHEREEVVGYFNCADLSTETGVTFQTGWELHPPWVGEVKDFPAMMRDEDPAWAERRVWPRVDFRKATVHLRTWFPRRGHATPGCQDMWYRFGDDGTRFTNETLGFVCDMFPQMLESFMLGSDPYSVEFEREKSEEEQKRIVDSLPKLWYPTLLMNVDFKKALPEEGVEFLFSRMQAKSIRNGRYDLEVLVLDMQGDLVAISNHVVFAVGVERNVAKRRKVDKAETSKL